MNIQDLTSVLILTRHSSPFFALLTGMPPDDAAVSLVLSLSPTPQFLLLWVVVAVLVVIMSYKQNRGGGGNEVKKTTKTRYINNFNYH